MFSSTEAAVAWAASILGDDARVCTYVPRDANGLPSEDSAICTVDRTGGVMDYPHDEPQITFQVWTKSEDKSEQLASILAVACKTMPPTDRHINHVQAPTVSSYGNMGTWFVWQVSVVWNVRLDD